MSEELEQAMDQTTYGRRSFLRRLVVGSAFAVPVVSSFSMAGIRAASAQATPTVHTCNSTYISTVNSTQPVYPHPCGPGGGGGILGVLEEIFQVFTHPFK